MSMKNWPITQDGQAVTATATSAATALAGATVVAAEDVMIDNPGPNDVYVRAGGSTVAATLASLRVPAGSLQPYRKGAGTTHIAMITRSGSQAVVLHVGDGQ